MVELRLLRCPEAPDVFQRNLPFAPHATARVSATTSLSPGRGTAGGVVLFLLDDWLWESPRSRARCERQVEGGRLHHAVPAAPIVRSARGRREQHRGGGRASHFGRFWDENAEITAKSMSRFIIK